jgi:hypothetical protein
MLKVLEKPLMGKEQQTVPDFVHEGVNHLTALMMNTVLKECAYEHQRNISPRHVAILADLMKRGQWQPKSQIDFAVFRGHYILVNGYHRAHAQVQSGKTIEWTVALHPIKTENELRTLYFAFDTNVRARSAVDILGANEFGAVHGLPAEMAKSLYAAVPYIASRFNIRPQDRNFLVERQVDLRLQIASEYAKAAGRFSACIEGLPGVRKKKLMSGAVTAVAVITLRYQSDTAWQFWYGVAQNDGLKRGDPRHALVMDMLSRQGTANKTQAFAPPIIAWNAYFNERELRLVKVMDSFKPVIDGTPFDGKVA